MKLLFVENRYATWVYSQVAKRLELQGHEIHWLVQNPVFAPSFGQTHIMPFPRGTAPQTNPSAPYDALAKTDRGILHFGASPDHYPHYDAQIGLYLARIRPDAIFGEATEFHELLTIRQAKALSIPYLSPNVTRYPSNRMAFMAYDTLEQVGGDGTALADADADAMLEGIRHRKVVPSYMRPADASQGPSRLFLLQDKLRITWGWLRGERFITPSPQRKLALNSAQKSARAQWESHAASQWSQWSKLVDSGQPWVLYALQMQPEGNIDVWGAPWNDQADLIRRAAKALAELGAVLVVKANPKSKYEMNDALNVAVRSGANIVALPHTTPMAEVFPRAPLVLSVTGTVLMECVFSGKPVASLGTHAMTQYPGVTAIKAPEAIAGVLTAVQAGEAARATPHQARALLQSLHSSSYPAQIWDPISQPHFATEEGLRALTAAFTHVLITQINASPSHELPR